MELLIGLPCHSVPTWTEHCSESNNALSWTESPAVLVALKFCFIRQHRKQWVEFAGPKFVGSPDIALISFIPLTLDPMLITIEVHIV
jgi:hypothetical protein